MKRGVACLAAVVLVFGLATQAQATAVRGNGIYEIHVETNSDGWWIGSWNAVTDVSHPTGAGNDLMFQNMWTTTNFSSLRVYGAAAPVDYTFGGSGDGTAVNMDQYFVSEGGSPLAPPGQGWRTQWSITRENLDVVQDVITVGTSLANSAIYHAVKISNTNDGIVSLGWRNLYDWEVDDPTTDDGPNNQIELPDGTVLVAATTTEFSRTPSPGEIVRVSIDPGTPSYQPLLGLGYDPGFRPDLTATTPDEYVYADWPWSYGSNFDYTPTAQNVTWDSAGLTWFGRDAQRAIVLGPYQSVRLNQVIFGVPPDEPPPVIPEPTTMALVGVGLLALARRRRRTN